MDPAPQDREMTILEHLAELRQRLIICVLATAVAMVVSAFFITIPLIELLAAPSGLKLVTLGPTEMIGVFFEVALTTGVALAMPVIVWQMLLFILPALHAHERRWVYLGVPSVTLAFVAGLAFGFFVVIPAGIQFLAGFGSGVVEANWSVARYVSFVASFIFWVGVTFETPIVVFVLAKLRIVNVRQLGRYRRYALVGAFIIGAIITPTPDPFNQVLVSLPIYLLYELGVLLARFA